MRVDKLGMNVHDSKKSGRYLSVRVEDTGTAATTKVANLKMYADIRGGK